jgi:hypothetical protein
VRATDARTALSRAVLGAVLVRKAIALDAVSSVSPARHAKEAESSPTAGSRNVRARRVIRGTAALLA